MDEKFLCFRDACSHFESYLNERDRLNEQLTIVQYRINGVHSTDFETAYKRESVKEKDILPLLAVKKELTEKKEEMERRIRFIEDTIKAIPYPSYRVFAWEVFILNRKYTEIADRYGYNAESFRKSLITSVNSVLSFRECASSRDSE